MYNIIGPPIYTYWFGELLASYHIQYMYVNGNLTNMYAGACKVSNIIRCPVANLLFCNDEVIMSNLDLEIVYLNMQRLSASLEAKSKFHS